MKCGREECLSCPWGKEGKGGECKREGVVYRITCMRCEREGTTAVYWGETARTGYERGTEHLAGLESHYEKNALWKHSSLYHEGSLERKEIKMEIIEGHRSP